MNEWIGEELIVFKESRGLPYSVIASKPLRVYAISKEDFLTNLPKDVFQYFEECARGKCKWLEQRFIEIAKNMNKQMMKDSYFEGITQKSNEV